MSLGHPKNPMAQATGASGETQELQSTQETQVSICKKREKDIWEITIRKTSCGSPVKFENKF